MKVCLLYEDWENRPKPVSMNINELVADLNLDIIYKTMARNDQFIYKTVRSVMMNPLSDQKAIRFRQGILEDCIKQYDGFLKIYDICAQALNETERYSNNKKKTSSNQLNVGDVLHAIELLEIMIYNLEKIKYQFDTIEEHFESHGMLKFYDSIVSDYSYIFLSNIKKSIKHMNFLTEGGEITFSSSVGAGLKQDHMVINSLKKKYTKRKKNMGIGIKFLFGLFHNNIILLEDPNLEQDARALETAGMADIIKMYQSFIGELEDFFENLHYQMAFYIGAANLKIRMNQLHMQTRMPSIVNEGKDSFRLEGLYDLSLALYNRHKPISNDLFTENRKLYIITGANQGGKSTYLRSIGIAQILMQNGMYVPAFKYCNCIFDGIFTHFTRREDTAMNSGKLDEELSRMNKILTTITPHSLLLMNESFATTTEREGSKIAQDVVMALYENNTKIIMVTHLFEFTKTMFSKKLDQAMFLSAERLEDGTRTYKIYEREPERTSYGVDLYDEIIENNKANNGSSVA